MFGVGEQILMQTMDVKSALRHVKSAYCPGYFLYIGVCLQFVWRGSPGVWE